VKPPMLSLLYASIFAQAVGQPFASGCVIPFDINAQPLDEALSEFANQSGLQVLFQTSEITSSVLAPKVTGNFTPGEALRGLLEGTSLRFEFVNARTIAIRLTSGQELDSDDIEEVVVTGSRHWKADSDLGANDVQPYVVFECDDLPYSCTQSDAHANQSRAALLRAQGAANQHTHASEGGQTVILVNGQRVDHVAGSLLDSITISSIERIEILPSAFDVGASPDVVNVVLKPQAKETAATTMRYRMCVELAPLAGDYFSSLVTSVRSGEGLIEHINGLLHCARSIRLLALAALPYYVRSTRSPATRKKRVVFATYPPHPSRRPTPSLRLIL
jgi:hypothetical protein